MNEQIIKNRLIFRDSGEKTLTQHGVIMPTGYKGVASSFWLTFVVVEYPFFSYPTLCVFSPNSNLYI